MSPEEEVTPAPVSPLPADSSPGTMLLTTVLSVIAGSADVISFLGLGGLFVAHVTGNLILIAAHIVTTNAVSPAHLLSVPLFILVLGLTSMLAAGLEARGIASLRPLLLLQFLLLAGFLALCVADSRVDSNAANAIFASMFGISAMAVQNALVQISLKETPATAVMTTNITRFIIDVGEVLLGRDPAHVARSRRRAKQTWPAIIGFIAGAGLGAACFAIAGLWSLALPAGLALLAFAMSLAARLDDEQR